MTNHLSNTITALRTILCFQIVFLHMHITATTPQDLQIDQYPIYNYIVTFITLLGRLAVPLFFSISGYLYFNTYSPHLESYIHKTKRRIRHLLQPILLWTTFLLILYLIFQTIPYTSNLLSGNIKLVKEFDWIDLLNAYTGIITGIPFVGQYWFLWKLLILSLLSPLIWYFIKYTKSTGLIILGFIWYFQQKTHIDPYLLTSVFFFTLGSYISYIQCDMCFSLKVKKIICLSFLLLLAVTYLSSIYSSPVKPYFYNIYILTGIPFLLVFCSWLIKKGYGEKLLKLSAGSYFCFLIHQQILMFLKRSIYKMINPHGDFILIILYFIIPILCICICYAIYSYLKKRHPKALKYLIGEK